jgi:hypothetical protein
MSLKAKYEFLFVGKDDNSFLENYAYDLFQEHGAKSGQIFVNLEIQNNLADGQEIGATIFETMQKFFFEDVERDPYERFEASLKEVNDMLTKYKSERKSGYIGNLNVVIAAIVGPALYLTQCGDAEAYLIRKRYVSIVSEGLDEDAKEGEVFSSIASGQIEAGDFVLFSSTRLLRYISKTDFAKAVSRKNIQDSLEDIKDTVSTEILGRIGMIGMGFDAVSLEEEKEFLAEEDTANSAFLESSENHVRSEKETLTGKFFSVFRKRRKKKVEVYDGSVNPMLANAKEMLGNVWGKIAGGGATGKLFIGLVVVIVLLLGGILFAQNSSEKNALLKDLEGTLTTVQSQIAEAQTKASYDKEAAKALLDSAREDSMMVLNSGYFREKANMLLVQIEETRDSIDEVIRIDNPPVFADLSEKRSDVNALGFVAVGDRRFVYEYNALYELVLDQIQDPLTIDEEESVITATAFGERGSIVFLTKSGKLIEYREGTVSFMDTDDGTFHKGTALADWSNRIYVLDAEGNQIWRYTYKGNSESFGSGEAWVSDSSVDFAGAKDIAIDANVFVLKGDGELLKFYAGSKVDFFLNNLPFNDFIDPTKIFTNENLGQIYILDASESRVFVFNKDSRTGNVDYVKQFYFSGVGELRDIYVNNDTNTLYVLSESKVYEVNLADSSSVDQE